MKRRNCVSATVGLLVCGTPSIGAVYFYDIFYSTFYEQTSINAPSEYSFNSFTARIIADADNVGAAEFASPLELSVGLPQIGSGYFLRAWNFDDPESMTDAFPSGNYIFGISGGSMGSMLGEIWRPSELTWCEEIPAFTPSCFDAMRSVEAEVDFYAEFNTFTGAPGANLAVTFLSVLDSSNVVVFNEFFPATDGSRVIPAGTLLPGRQYRAILYFSSREEFASGDFGGSTSIAAFDRVTTAPLFTRSACVGDLNNDGFVDDVDFSIFAVGYNVLDCVDPEMQPGCPADLNRDGVVDDADFSLFVPAYDALLCPEGR